MNQNNEIHFIENANKILFELVTKLKDYWIDVRASGNYEYSKDYTSLNFVENIDELDSSKHDKKFTDRIAELEKECEEKQKEIDGLLRDKKSINDNLLKNAKEIYNMTRENNEMKKKISELESELSVKENLPKTKNGLRGEEIPKEVTVDGFKCDIIQTAQGLYIDRDRIYEIIEREKEPIKKKCAELENRHQSDCITINQLHTALDVMTEKYQKLREIHGL